MTLNRRMPYIISALFLLAFLSIPVAASINITEPYPAIVPNNGSMYLGKVGPGQPFYVTAESTAINASGIPIERGWNQLNATGLPAGWVVTNSSVYSEYLTVRITPSSTAANGTYTFRLIARNFGNYSKLGIVEFTAYVNVTPDVFSLTVNPYNITTGPGEPSNIYITINNTGVSDSPFYINAQGLPAWNGTEDVIALHQTSRTFVYPIYEYEPGTYKARMYVGSTASSLVHKQANVTMVVRASVPNDYKAIGYGAAVFPVIYEPVYAVMYLLRLLFGAL